MERLAELTVSSDNLGEKAINNSGCISNYNTALLPSNELHNFSNETCATKAVFEQMVPRRLISMPVQWSPEELQTLNEGLSRYANMDTVIKYIKIAEGLPNKSIRDVALQARWMKTCSRKRRKATRNDVGKSKEEVFETAPVLSASANADSDISENTSVVPSVEQTNPVNGFPHVAFSFSREEMLLNQNAAMMQDIDNKLMGDLNSIEIVNNFHMLGNLTRNFEELEQRFSTVCHFNNFRRILKSPPLETSVDYDLLNRALALNSILFGLLNRGSSHSSLN